MTIFQPVHVQVKYQRMCPLHPPKLTSVLSIISYRYAEVTSLQIELSTIHKRCVQCVVGLHASDKERGECTASSQHTGIYVISFRCCSIVRLRRSQTRISCHWQTPRDALQQGERAAIPHLHLAPPLGVTPFEFCRDFRHQKTRIHGLSSGVVCVILRLAVSVEHRLVTDRQTHDDS